MTEFAKGLVAGTVKASAKICWWPAHLRTLLRYFQVSFEKEPCTISELEKELVSGAKEWELMVPRAAKQGLMFEHVRLEMALVNAALRRDSKRIDQVGKKLFDNATASAAAMGIAVVEFPEEPFRRLIRDHVGLYAACVRRRMEGSQGMDVKLEANTLQLATFTAEWF